MLRAIAFGVLVALSLAEDFDFIRDPGVQGPPLETVHAYYNQWPTGAGPPLSPKPTHTLPN